MARRIVRPDEDATSKPMPELAELEGVDLEAAGVRLFDDTRELPVALTEQEWTSYVEQNAVNWAEIEAEEAAEKERRGIWSAEHRARKAEHSRVAKLVHDHAEPRDVKIAGYGIVESNAVVVVRIDTGKPVEVRAMDANEREKALQGDLFPQEAK